MKRVPYYFRAFILRPLRAPEEIERDSSNLRAGFWFTLFFGTVYSLVVFVYYLLGHEPVTKPFLTIPLEKWYLVQTFTTIPVAFAGLFSYAGLAYLISRALGGEGSFDATFASQSFAFFIPTLIFMWLPEAFYFPFRIGSGDTRFPWPSWIEYLRVFIIPLAWTLLLAVNAMSRIHRLHLLKGLLAVIVSSIPMVMIMAVFIR